MSSDRIETPFDHDRVHVGSQGEIAMADGGVNVSAASSNIDAQRVPGVFAHFVDAIADKLGVNLRNGLFDDFHPMSNVDALEGYVRYTDEEKSKPSSTMAFYTGFSTCSGIARGISSNTSPTTRRQSATCIR